MKKISRLGMIALLLVTGSSVFSQLKLGGNPTSIQKSSILELESPNQGLLLSRINDTTAINTLNPPDGMIIYYTPINQLMVRSGGNWHIVNKGSLQLSGLGDVLMTSPVNGQILRYNGTKWVNFTPNYLTSVDTTDIASFHLKVKSLFSGNAPITFSNGVIGITQATASTDGYLSSADWNTFNNKVNASSVSGSVNYIPKFTAAGAIGNSSLIDNGTVINTGSLIKYNGNYATQFDARTLVDKYYVDSLQTSTITGAVWSLSGNAITSSHYLGTSNNRSLRFRTNNVQTMIIDSLGNVGIGVSLPSEALDVEGNIQFGRALMPNGNPGTSGAFLTSAGPNAPAQWLTINGTAPISYNNGTISIAQANSTTNGYLSSSDWNTFNNKLATVDTSNIAGFSTKVRSLFSGSSPITYSAGTIGITQASSSTNGYLSSADWNMFNSKGGGSVTSVSVTTANGVSGTVSNPTTTPAISLTLGAITPTSVTASGAITGSNLSGTNTGNVTIGTANGLSLAGQTLSLAMANSTTTGALSYSDWTTFNSKLSSVDTSNIAGFSAKVRSLFSGTAPITYSAGTIGITQASTSTNGYLSSSDWNMFNNKAGGFSGTANYLAKFTGTGNTIGISLLQDNGTQVSLSGLIKYNGNYGSAFDARTLVDKNYVDSVKTATLASGWSLTGNAGTTAGTNFIGTTDDRDLVLKRNSVQAGLLNNALLNTSFGVGALNPNTSGTANTALGHMALSSNTTGISNTAVGQNALSGNTTGGSNTAIGLYNLFSNTTGNHNTSLGMAALQSSTTGSYNTASGYKALYSNVAGSNGTAIGYNSQYYVNNSATPWNNLNTSLGYASLMGSNNAANNTGNWNIAVGNQALTANTSGNNNSGVGTYSLITNTSGSYNTATGFSSLFSNTSGGNNISIGGNTLYANTTGSNNAALGHGTLYSNVAGSNGVAIGYYSQYYANNTATAWTNDNTSVGYQSLQGSTTSANNTGTSNTALGYQTLLNNTSGSQNTGVGAYSLYNNTTGSSNLGLGHYSLYTNTTGTSNAGLGHQALRYNTTGNYNSASGFAALYSNTTGSSNTSEGYLSSYSNTVGANNTAVGASALNSNISGSNAVAVGAGSQQYANNTVSPWTNSNTSIGYQSLQGSVSAGSNTGNYNTAAGYRAMASNTTGSYNVALGYTSLQSNTSGYLNTALGHAALVANTTGYWNTATGNALGANTSGISNTATGYYALQSNTTGNYNTSIGLNSLYSNTTGSGNTAIGYYAGYGDGTINTPGNLTNATAIGYYAQVTASNAVVLGGTGLYAANVGIGTTAPSSKLDVFGTGRFVNTNPLTLLGVQAGAVSDSILTITDGTVRKLATATLVSGTAWSLTGNAGTTAGTNFIGTTDNVNVVFKRNGVQAGLLDHNTFNTSFGVYALNPASTGASNVAVGNQALMSNTTGYYNNAIGAVGLSSNTTGHGNNAMGFMAMQFNTTGNNNTGIGQNVLNRNVSGSANTATGNMAMYFNTTGSANEAYGDGALTSNTIGTTNLAIGGGALYSNVAGSYGVAIGNSSQRNVNNSTVAWTNDNTSVGFQSLQGSGSASSNTGTSNTALGYQTLLNNSTGSQNTATGAYSLYTNSSGSSNTAIGHQALRYNSNGNNNAAVGFGSLYSNTSGSTNTSVGYLAAYSTTVGASNTVLGSSALNSNVAGSGAVAIGTNSQQYANNSSTPFNNSNVSVGFESLKGSATPASNTGNANVAIGYMSLTATTSGSNNTASGTTALFSNTTGSNNTAIGMNALSSNTTGNYNVSVGANAAASNTTGASVTAIGYNAGYTDGTTTTPNNLTNATAIGYNAQVTASNSLVLGGTGSNAVNVGIGTTAPQYKLDVNGTTNITGNLTGTTAVFSGNITANSDYRLKKNIRELSSVSESLRNINAVEFDRKDVDLHQLGFIAQNVQQYFPALVTVGKDSAQTLSLNYQAMTSPLLKGWQEHDEVIRKQQAEIDVLRKQMADLKAIIDELKKSR